MGIVNKSIPRIYKDALGNTKVEHSPVPEEVVIDDAFDPIFNAKAREYLTNKYGNPVIGTLGGYAEMWENALAPKDNKWGKLGPAMGVLGTFGRTIDKAEDFILGGITEGVNALNYINPLGTREIKPSNPLENIFVKDEDYTGQRLFAAMGNSMAKLAGGTTLNEGDFQGTWAIPSTAVELMTDPGILGGSLAKAYSPSAGNMTSAEILKRLHDSKAIDGTTLGDVSQLLSNYDDLLAKGAWDVTLPGFRPLVKNTFGKILKLVGASDKGEYVDMPLEDMSGATKPTSPSSPPSTDLFNIEQPDIVSYTTDVKKAMKDFQGMQFDTANDVAYQQIVEDLLDAYPEIWNDPDLVNDINKIKATLEARDLVTKGPNREAFLKAQKEYSAAKQELDNLKKLHSAEPNYDYSIAESKLDNIRQKAVEEGRKFYFHTDAFDDYLEKSNKNLNTVRERISRDSAARNVKYNKELKDITDMFKGMPNSPKNIHVYNENIDDILKKDPRALEGFKSTYKNEATSDLGRTISYDSYIKKISDKYADMDKYNYENYPDEVADELRAKLEKQFEEETSQASKNFITKILEGEAGEYPENVIHKHNLEEFLGLTKMPSYADNLKTPVYFSLSTKRFRNEVMQGYLDYGKERIRKAIIETPNAWHSKSAREYLDSIMVEPEVRKALSTLDYTDSKGNLHNYVESKLEYVLDRIMTGTYVTKKGTVKPINNIEKYLETYLGTKKHEGLLSVLERLDRSLNYNKIDVKGTSLEPLMAAGRDIRKTFDELSIGSAEDVIAKPINQELNSYLHANPTFFMDSKTNAINLDKLKTYTDKAPDFEVQLDEEMVLKHGLIQNGKFTKPEVLQKASKKDKYFLSKYLDYVRDGKATLPKLDRGVSIVETLDAMRTRTTKKLENEFRTSMDEIISKTATEDIFETNFNTSSQFNTILYSDIDADVLAMYKKDPLSPPSPENLTDEGKYFFDLLEESKAVRPRNARGDFASLRAKDVTDEIGNAERVGKTMTFGQKEQYHKARDLAKDDIIPKDRLLNEVVLSRGLTIGALPKNSKIDDFEGLRKVIDHNIAVTTLKLPNGTELPLFKKLEFSDDVNNYVGMCLNTDPKVVKNINKFNFKDVQDVVFHKGIPDNPKVIEVLSKYKELNAIYDRAENISSAMMTKLGFSEMLDEGYFKHALVFGNENAKRAKWLDDNIYSKVDADALDNMSNVLANKLNLKGVFGTQNTARSLRGNIASWNANANIFSYEPDYILKSQFSTGIYANQDVQTYTDLFINDNFKLSTYKMDENRLKTLLGLRDSKGRFGNANNMELVAPIYDKESGRLVKFKRYDKLSDTGIAQALKNPDTILVPTWSIAPLDKMLRKDAKMSNRVYAAFNKYLNLPFKFGTLINPGFLIGNANDAIMKQATTMSTKYGTSFVEELANASVAVKQAIQINNSFTDEIWNKYLADNADIIEKQPYLKIMGNMPESVASRKHFMDWFNAKSPTMTPEQISITRLWMYINSSQVTTAFRDFDLDEVAKTNVYDIKNPVETALNKVTVGNPIGKKVLDYSEGIETLARSSSVLNDLTHKYSIDDIERILDPQYRYEWNESGRILKNGTYKTSKEYRDLEVNIQNAINAMNNANFDYNNMPDFVDFMSTFIPFPTFYLKNMSYWVDVAVNNPEYIDTAITIQDNAWRDRQKELKTDKFTAEAKGRGAIPLDSITSVGRISSKLPNPLSSITPQIKGIFKPSPLNSMFGAFNSLQNPIKDIGQRAHPILSPVTHHLLDAEDVKYRPYSSNPYEKNIKKGDPNFSMLKYTFHRLNPYERVINTGLRTPNKLKEGTAQLYDFDPSVFQPDFGKKSSNNKK